MRSCSPLTCRFSSKFMFDKTESCSTMRITNIKATQRLLFPPRCSVCHLMSLLILHLTCLVLFSGWTKRCRVCLALVLAVFYASLFKLTSAAKSKCRRVKYLHQLFHLHRRAHVRVIRVRVLFMRTFAQHREVMRRVNTCVK